MTNQSSNHPFEVLSLVQSLCCQRAEILQLTNSNIKSVRAKSRGRRFSRKIGSEVVNKNLKGARPALLRPSVHASGPSVHRPLFSRTCFRQKKSWEPRVSVVRKNLFFDNFDNILLSVYFLLYWQHRKIERNPNWLWGLIWKIFFWQNDLVGNMIWSMTAITVVWIHQ